MTQRSKFFANPQGLPMRRYEALRAYLHEGRSMREAARRGGFTYGSFRNLCSRFRKTESIDFFWPQPAPTPKTDKPEDPRPERIVALRKQHNASIEQIMELLKEEDLKASLGYVYNVFKAAGIARLPRRTAEQRSVRAIRAVKADRRALDLSARTVHTDFAGLFLFAFDLARMQLDDQLTAVQMPGTRMIPAGCMVRALLALKLWGIGRPSHAMAETLDQGLALFTGLNVIPKRSALTEYATRVDPRFSGDLMNQWYHAAVRLQAPLGHSASFDLDFHTIPYHGDQALLQKHFVSKRSRRQRGVLTMLARDAEARLFSYADCTVRKGNQNDAVLRFVDYWSARTGAMPRELVFDSRFTIQKNLARLNEMNIDFITLRRRFERLNQRIHTLPKEAWRKITLTNIGRAYRTPRIVDEQVTLNHYPGQIRQLLILGLGHDRPTVLITNQMKRSAAKLVDRYARRMVIENVISDAIDFFHMDALSSAVPLKINVDVQLTVMASVLYRMLGMRVGQGYEVAEARTLFNHLVRHSGTVTLTEDEIIVTLRARTYMPYLTHAGYLEQRERIPWLGNKLLRIRFT